MDFESLRYLNEEQRFEKLLRFVIELKKYSDNKSFYQDLIDKITLQQDNDL